MQNDIKDLRKFGLLLSLVLILISGYHALKDRLFPVLLILAAALSILPLIYPKALAPVKWTWDKIGTVLGMINTYILLVLVYFVIITPVGLIMRLLGKDILKRKPQTLTGSYWEQVPATAESSMERQF